MTLQEILAKAKEDATFDLEGAVTKHVAEAVAEATSAVNDKNSELLGKLKTAKKVADGLPEDFSVEKWKELNKMAKDIDIAKLKGEEAVEAVKKQMQEAHAAELKAFEAKEAKLTSALESQLIDNAATKAIVEAGGNATLLLPHVKTGIKMQQNDEGEFVAVVVDPRGTERFSMVNAGKHMDISELVNELKTKDTFKSAFVADSSGGGAGRGHGGTKTANPWAKGTPDYNLTEQAKIMNADPDLGKQLQEQAGASPAA
ncbi:MAG: hypothetical protein OEQ39_00175 [Gammaproteobacteria bacterium]|nr:hypothetical protein [Gammaproteobacteria bacterium]